MKLVKYLFVLGSGIFAACGSPQQPIASPTPQEKSSTISHSLHFLTEHL